MITKDVMKSPITLHGLGFIQVQLEAQQRLHVWHPDLPRRHCFESSSIHNHRFDFESRVLVGSMRNIEFSDSKNEEGEYFAYLHSLARSKNGGRPWVREEMRVDLSIMKDFEVNAGDVYFQHAYCFHKTETLGSGKVATIMKKGYEGSFGAHSLCKVGVDPETDFDRFQLSTDELWAIVIDVLSSSVVK